METGRDAAFLASRLRGGLYMIAPARHKKNRKFRALFCIWRRGEDFLKRIHALSPPGALRRAKRSRRLVEPPSEPCGKVGD